MYSRGYNPDVGQVHTSSKVADACFVVYIAVVNVTQDLCVYIGLNPSFQDLKLVSGSGGHAMCSV